MSGKLLSFGKLCRLPQSQGLADVFGEAIPRGRQGEQLGGQGLNRAAQLAGVGGFPQGSQLMHLVGSEHPFGTQAIERGLSLVIDPFGAQRIVGGDFLFQAHHRLEEVVVQPELVIELVEQIGLRHRIQALVTDVSPHQAEVVLFHKAVIVLLKGAAAGEFHSLELALQEFEQESVEKLAAIVWVELHERERKAAEDALKAIFQDQKTAPQGGGTFAPTGGHIHQLETVHVLPLRAGPTVMDQVGFTVTCLGVIPSDAAHGNSRPEWMGRSRAFLAVRQTSTLRLSAWQQAPHGGNADLSQLLKYFRGEAQFAVLAQVFGLPAKVGLKPLGTWLIQALSDTRTAACTSAP